MAVPKHKTSKARKRSRNTANFKATVPTLGECSSCHAKKPAHAVCPTCGNYKGKTRIDVAAKKETK